MAEEGGKCPCCGEALTGVTGAARRKGMKRENYLSRVLKRGQIRHEPFCDEHGRVVVYLIPVKALEDGEAPEE